MNDDHRAQRAPYIAVVGPAEPDAETYALAVEAGRLIAERGAVVVCGGLGGVMEAAARGASDAGGSSLGILPGADRAQANRYLTMAVATGLGELRNALVVRCSDGVLAVGGSWGTLSEVALGAAVKGIVAAESAVQAVEALIAAVDDPARR